MTRRKRSVALLFPARATVLTVALAVVLTGCRGSGNIERDTGEDVLDASSTEHEDDCDRAASAPESAEPDSAYPESAELDSAALESAEPDTADLESAEPEGAKAVQDSFYYTPLTEDIRAYITGKSYPDTGEPLQISCEELAWVHVLHYDFEGQVQEGELICNQAIAQDLVDIFLELYENRYPIEKIRLIDEYDADDEASMADNNTSCFNYRVVPGTTKLSNHSYGFAIDINPLYNPYVRTRGGRELISPDNAAPYADRSADFPHKIDEDDLCRRIFIEHGFTWGGAWNSSKDYQHFEKVP